MHVESASFPRAYVICTCEMFKTRVNVGGVILQMLWPAHKVAVKK